MGEHRSVNRLWHFYVNVLGASGLVTGHTRMRLLRRGGIDPKTTQIRPGAYFFSSRISFGESGVVGENAHFENREFIYVGSRVFIGPRIYIATSSHELGGADQRAGDYVGGPVSIGDGCWIGANATILPGVVVAPGCVVGAGAVVTKSTEPHGLYLGVPARRCADLAI